MAGLTGLARFWTTMTAETGRWIDPPFNPVTCKIIPAMLYPTVIPSLVLQGRFEFNAGGMAVVAKALGVTDRTDPLVLISHQTMRLRE